MMHRVKNTGAKAPAGVTTSASRRLVAYFQECQQRNPAFSLRAFARQIGMGPGALSEILGNKRPLTLKLGMRILERLKMPEAEAREFLSEVTQSELQRNAELQIGQLEKYVPSFRKLDPHSPDTDQYRAIAEWQHFAILSLLETDDFKFQYQAIADRLGISLAESRASIDRLCRLGLVQRQGNQLQLSQSGCASTTENTSQALRESHRQNLNQGLSAIEGVPVELRDFSSITLAIDPAKIPLAKALIRTFRRFAAQVLETGAKQEVYALNIQFIPLTQRRQK